MRIVGDTNLASTFISVAFSALVSLIVARAIVVRQARAKTKEDARRRMACLIGPLLCHVRLLIDGPPDARVAEVPKKLALVSDEPDLLAEIAKTTDDLGFWRAWRVRCHARRVFGRVEYDYVWLGRWNDPESRAEAMLTKMVISPGWTVKRYDASRKGQLGLWAECQDSARPIWKLRELERQLGRLYACGGRPPPPRVVRRWRRCRDLILVNWCAALDRARGR